jgi:hypothetical protein
MVPMEEVKETLKQIVADLEKSAAPIEALRSGANIEVTALDLAVQKNRELYKSLRKQTGRFTCRARARRRISRHPL